MYEELKDALDAAYARATAGKGKERHANDKAFVDQPILTIARMVGPGGHAFQIMKKAQEALRLPDEQAANELLDIMVYAAAWRILLTEGAANEKLCELMNRDPGWRPASGSEEIDHDRLSKEKKDRICAKAVASKRRRGLSLDFIKDRPDL